MFFMVIFLAEIKFSINKILFHLKPFHYHLSVIRLYYYCFLYHNDGTVCLLLLYRRNLETTRAIVRIFMISPYLHSSLLKLTPLHENAFRERWSGRPIKAIFALVSLRGKFYAVQSLYWQNTGSGDVFFKCIN